MGGMSEGERGEGGREGGREGERERASERERERERERASESERERGREREKERERERERERDGTHNRWMHTTGVAASAQVLPPPLHTDHGARMRVVQILESQCPSIIYTYI